MFTEQFISSIPELVSDLSEKNINFQIFPDFSDPSSKKDLKIQIPRCAHVDRCCEKTRTSSAEYFGKDLTARWNQLEQQLFAMKKTR